MNDGLFSQGIKKNGEQSVSLGVTQRFSIRANHSPDTYASCI